MKILKSLLFLAAIILVMFAARSYRNSRTETAMANLEKKGWKNLGEKKFVWLGVPYDVPVFAIQDTDSSTVFQIGLRPAKEYFLRVPARVTVNPDSMYLSANFLTQQIVLTEHKQDGTRAAYSSDGSWTLSIPAAAK